MPLLSVLIATYNDGDLVSRAIDSVLNQTLPDVEVIVIDDGSEDGTYQQLNKSYGSAIRVLREENKGCGPARNLGFTHASGTYLNFLDADDVYLPWAVATIAATVESADHPPFLEVAALASPDSAEFSKIGHGPLRLERFGDFLANPGASGHSTLPSNAVVRADVFARAGGFWNHRIGEDTDLWLRLGEEPGFVRVESPVCVGRTYSLMSYGEKVANRVLCARLLVAAERAGRYPGGVARSHERHECIGVVVRSACQRSIGEGSLPEAWRLYAVTAAWHVRMRRYKYLFGFPILASAEGIRRALRKRRRR